MNRTNIEWCDYTWNPVVGCTKGCAYCYARRQAKRFKQRCRQCYDFTPHLHPERLEEPMRVKRPSRIFVGSMGELFDPEMLVGATASVLLAIDATIPDRQHTFMLLTKRPEFAVRWPMSHLGIWLGTSVTDQPSADERIPKLLECDADVHFVSYEPAHGPVDFVKIAWRDPKYALCDILPIDGIDWLIIGAETGNRKGKVVPERAWIQSALDQARAEGVPVFVKDNVVKLYPEFKGIREWPKEAPDGGE